MAGTNRYSVEGGDIEQVVAQTVSNAIFDPAYHAVEILVASQSRQADASFQQNFVVNSYQVFRRKQPEHRAYRRASLRRAERFCSMVSLNASEKL